MKLSLFFVVSIFCENSQSFCAKLKYVILNCCHLAPGKFQTNAFAIFYQEHSKIIMYIYEPGMAGNFICIYFSLMTELYLRPPFLFTWLGISMPICCMRQRMPVCMQEAKPRAAKRACFFWGHNKVLLLAKEGKNKRRREVKFSHRGKN